MINKITKYLVIGVASMLMAASSHADTKVQFALDWKFEGPSAPYFLAIDKGHFKSAGMDVEITPGKGSLDAIPKVPLVRFLLASQILIRLSNFSIRTQARL